MNIWPIINAKLRSRKVIWEPEVDHYWPPPYPQSSQSSLEWGQGGHEEAGARPPRSGIVFRTPEQSQSMNAASTPSCNNLAAFTFHVLAKMEKERKEKRQCYFLKWP